ncbi:MAG: Maf family nucleotide pyrophosphatase [Parvibaculaceae bacterium]|nr:Maf family nucleotide pyrophosphatase [Parvibaculaceae bacterium]|tara:strand:+ start:525 stop:1121 length:597 start_codon:yes stop_codon:yes gene_type:complete
MSDMPTLILASRSGVRASLLENAGIHFRVEVSPVDEDEAKKGFEGGGNDLAKMLAEMKAQAVSAEAGDQYVIGADQVLSCDGRMFDKPKNLDQVHENLSFFRGKTHTLHSAVTVARGGERQWSHVAEAHLTMRDYSDEFIAHYIRRVGDKLLKSVGCYQLEGPGVQLFERIEGDYFTILGLPLLPLFTYLRAEGVLEK